MTLHAFALPCICTISRKEIPEVDDVSNNNGKNNINLNNNNDNLIIVIINIQGRSLAYPLNPARLGGISCTAQHQLFDFTWRWMHGFRIQLFSFRVGVRLLAGLM